MLENIQIESILFLDIETVPMAREYEGLPEPFRSLWDKKAETLTRSDKLYEENKRSPAEVYERAGIYAEFGRVVCISTGVLRNGSLWIKSFSGHDEKALLNEFAEMLLRAGGKKFQYLCAHNGKEFDFPYLIRRMLINGIAVPPILDLVLKKPWEVNHFDTMELWKFGDFKNYTSLELLAAVFGIPTPKDDIHGSDVARVFYEENDLSRIVKYCQKDVVTIVNLFLRFQMKPVIEETEIQYIQE